MDGVFLESEGGDRTIKKEEAEREDDCDEREREPQI